MTKEEIVLGIKWKIDHDYAIDRYLLIGDFNGQRFVEGVYDGLWGFPLMYSKWCIERRFLILYKS